MREKARICDPVPGGDWVGELGSRGNGGRRSKAAPFPRTAGPAARAAPPYELDGVLARWPFRACPVAILRSSRMKEVTTLEDARLEDLTSGPTRQGRRRWPRPSATCSATSTRRSEDRVGGPARSTLLLLRGEADGPTTLVTLTPWLWMLFGPWICRARETDRVGGVLVVPGCTIVGSGLIERG